VYAGIQIPTAEATKAAAQLVRTSGLGTPGTKGLAVSDEQCQDGLLRRQITNLFAASRP
jgi:hypothetical protein